MTPAQEGHWAPGYYYVLCDHDGIRVEANHVPGQGVWRTTPDLIRETIFTHRDDAPFLH